jgi:hypothetical protein
MLLNGGIPFEGIVVSRVCGKIKIILLILKRRQYDQKSKNINM